MTNIEESLAEQAVKYQFSNALYAIHFLNSMSVCNPDAKKILETSKAVSNLISKLNNDVLSQSVRESAKNYFERVSEYATKKMKRNDDRLKSQRKENPYQKIASFIKRITN